MTFCERWPVILTVVSVWIWAVMSWARSRCRRICLPSFRSWIWLETLVSIWTTRPLSSSSMFFLMFFFACLCAVTSHFMCRQDAAFYSFIAFGCFFQQHSLLPHWSASNLFVKRGIWWARCVESWLHRGLGRQEQVSSVWWKKEKQLPSHLCEVKSH